MLKEDARPLSLAAQAKGLRLGVIWAGKLASGAHMKELRPAKKRQISRRPTHTIDAEGEVQTDDPMLVEAA